MIIHKILIGNHDAKNSLNILFYFISFIEKKKEKERKEKKQE